MEQKTKTFLIRFIIFILTAIGFPIAYLIIRYNLFQTTSKLQIGLWGCIVFFILAVSIKVLISFYLEGMKTKYSLMKQIVTGFSHLILPLIALLIFIIWMKDNIDLLIEALGVIIPCEIVAIIINPLPKWCFDNNIDGLGEIVDKTFNLKKGE